MFKVNLQFDGNRQDVCRVCVTRPWQWGLHNKISTHMRGWKQTLSLLLHENTARSYLLSRHQKVALTRHQICQHLDLAASASEPVRNTFLSFLSHSIYGIVLQQSEETKAMVIARRLISPRDGKHWSIKTKPWEGKKITTKTKDQQRTIEGVAGGGGCDWKWPVHHWGTSVYRTHCKWGEGEGEGETEKERGGFFLFPK